MHAVDDPMPARGPVLSRGSAVVAVPAPARSADRAVSHARAIRPRGGHSAVSSGVGRLRGDRGRGNPRRTPGTPRGVFSRLPDDGLRLADKPLLGPALGPGLWARVDGDQASGWD